MELISVRGGKKRGSQHTLCGIFILPIDGLQVITCNKETQSCSSYPGR